mgnify:FL=1
MQEWRRSTTDMDMPKIEPVTSVYNTTAGREYRYQQDWSIGPMMFHVRCDNWDEFKGAVANMQAIIPGNKPFPEDSGNTATPKEKAVGAPECGDHHVPMSWRAPGVSKNTGKPYPGFWACPEKVNGQFCSYRPK